MSRRPPRNMAASVKQRLLNLADERGEDFNFLLVRYAAERLLYRLSQSEYSGDFVLKGAMLFHLGPNQSRYRPTRDIDLLGKGSPDLERLEGIFRKLCEIQVPDDGLVLLPKSVKARRIQEEAEYKGIRVNLETRMGSARIAVQIDVGFGDALERPLKRESLATLLDFPPPHLPVYPWEGVIAEKFQALVERGMGNSRMKDYFDLRHLAGTLNFDGAKLARAIEATFERRRMELPKGIPIGLSEAFAQDSAKQAQWRAFLRRLRVDAENDPLEGVVERVRAFLMPPVEAVASGKPFKMKWPASGPWCSP